MARKPQGVQTCGDAIAPVVTGGCEYARGLGVRTAKRIADAIAGLEKQIPQDGELLIIAYRRGFLTATGSITTAGHAFRAAWRGRVPTPRKKKNTARNARK